MTSFKIEKSKQRFLNDVIRNLLHDNICFVSPIHFVNALVLIFCRVLWFPTFGLNFMVVVQLNLIKLWIAFLDRKSSLVLEMELSTGTLEWTGCPAWINPAGPPPGWNGPLLDRLWAWWPDRLNIFKYYYIFIIL